jgi:diaminohydroxyphosphoribosylaminopyrimidine deaminase/5-amino-6-(5-phosphoribosylamino)uracil reductase
MNTDKKDTYYMQKAIDAAWSGMNMTSPNPRVGCVIVKDDRIIGSGYHTAFGKAHAEIEAIESASESVAGSTVYVTLEPCSHYGKTPPCVNSLAEEGVKRVVIGVKDPNPEVDGIGFLKEKGIEVETSVLEEEARELIKDYLEFNVKKKPYVTVKGALSWDGKIATKTGDSKWISSEASREFTMKLRGQHDAILAGANTVNCDNPSLTYRLDAPVAKDPLRIVLDGRLTVNTDAAVINKNTVVITSNNADKDKIKEIEKKGVEVVIIGSENTVSAEAVLKYLYERNIMSVLVEGGGTTAGNFISSSLVNRVIFVYGPMIIGGKDSPTACDGPGVEKITQAVRLKNIKRFEFADDLVMQGDIA